MDMTLKDFERWLEQTKATGYNIPATSYPAIEKIRACLKAGGTMSTPIKD